MIIALIFFTLITLTGIIVLKTFIRDERPFVLLPAGMLFGTALYIFLLNQFSHLFRGLTGIMLTSILMCLVCVCLFYRIGKFRLFSKISLFGLIIPAILTMIIFYSIQARMRTIPPAADSTIQWAYAGSFARGNYPLRVPWQPDFSPGYHLGAYYLEGALQSLSNLPWVITHTLINIFFLFSSSLLAIFLFWDGKYSYKNLWLVITILITFIAFGIVVLAIPTTAVLNNTFSTEKFIRLINTLLVLPQKGTAGAALVDINSLSYLPARSLGIGLSLLILYFFTRDWKKTFWKITLVILTISTLAFVEESTFLPLFLTLAFFTVLSLIPPLKRLNLPKKELIVIALGCLVLIIIQGGFITDQFVNQKANSAFNITLPVKGSRFFEKIQKTKNDNKAFSDLGVDFITLNPFWLSILPLFYGLLKKRKELIIISLFSLISLMIFLLVEYKYDLSNNIRFYNFSYIAAGLSISYMLFYVFRNRSYFWHLLFLAIILPLVIIPTAGPELYKQVTALSHTRKLNITSPLWQPKISNIPSEQIRNWVAKNLPLNSRILVLGRDSLTPESSEQFQYKGIYTTFGPQYIKVLRQEPGIEYFDLSLTLNPSLFKQTKTEYLYIESESQAFKQLPQFRKDDLANNKYFEILQAIELKDEKNQPRSYKLYKIKQKFLDPTVGGKDIEYGTLQQLDKLIPKDATVYVSDYGEPNLLNFWYRMAIILSMKDRRLFRNPTQTDYMAIETFIPYQSPENDQIYDYYVLSPADKPKVPAQKVWSNIYANAWKSNLTKE